MQLTQGHHLTYCTNIHRGETWPEVFHALQTHALAVRDRVGDKDTPFGLGLRLGVEVVRELSDAAAKAEFRRWLERENCYVFTINGFPYGRFHGTRVKEQVYHPGWHTPERLEYTKALFDLLAELVPPGGEGSVSTLPLSFKTFDLPADAKDQWRRHVEDCARHLHRLRRATGRDLHLGLEPEPLCTLETSAEFIDFMADFDDDVRAVVGINYDCCHLALEYEEPRQAFARLREAGLRVSKLHLSSALRLTPTPEALEKLRAFHEETYLHQVIVKPGALGPAEADGLRRYVDLPNALQAATEGREGEVGDEWRVHFHIPLHAAPGAPLFDTRDHLQGALDALAAEPGLCRHLEIETYTWEVLPPALRQLDVTASLADEYHWVLAELRTRGLA